MLRILFKSLPYDKAASYRKKSYRRSSYTVELHAYFPQEDLRNFSEQRGVTLTAYAPIGSPGRPPFLHLKDEPNLLQDPIIAGLGKKYNKNPAQILLRNIIQRGIIVIPKSITPSRIRENIDIFDFTLSEEDMTAVKELNKNLRLFCTKTARNHPEYPHNIPF